MIRITRTAFIAMTAAGLLAVAACSSSDSGTTDTTSTTGGGSGGAFAVDTSKCPADATAPIKDTIKIGTTMPLSGGPAAVAFAPVADGLKNYIKYANANNLVPGYKIELTVSDDQFNSNLTTPAVNKLIDDTKVNLFTGMIGTANNEAVRDTLNQNCYPQLFTNSGSPIWGQVDQYPWTLGGLAPYNTETAVYVKDIEKQFPDGTTAAVFHVNSDFGDAYQTALEALAPAANIDIVEEQTIESEDSNPPTAQVNAIAAKKPDVILAVPLGAQCPTFLKALADAKAANSGWEPRVYITSTCASTLLLAISGDAADGIFTTVTGIDPNDPANTSVPAVADYKKAMTDLGYKSPPGDFATAGAGWTTGENTVEVLRLAAKSKDGLTRASILNAARSLDYHPSLARPGINFKTNGAKDAYGLESMQVVQYSAKTKTYTDIGQLSTEFEGKTVVPTD